jgi:hypothetical protein
MVSALLNIALVLTFATTSPVKENEPVELAPAGETIRVAKSNEPSAVALTTFAIR